MAIHSQDKGLNLGGQVLYWLENVHAFHLSLSNHLVLIRYLRTLAWILETQRELRISMFFFF